MKVGRLLAVMALATIVGNSDCVAADDGLPGSKETLQELAKIVMEMPPGAGDLLVARMQQDGGAIAANPFILLGAAEQAFEKDAETAAAWYYLGQLRLRYDVGRCVERSAEASMTIAPLLAPKTVRYLRENPKVAARSIERALVWDDQYTELGSPTGFEGKAVCAITLPPNQRAERPDQPPWLIARAEWPAIKQRLLEGAKTAVRELNAK